jgi:hypothetical protein
MFLGKLEFLKDLFLVPRRTCSLHSGVSATYKRLSKGFAEPSNSKPQRSPEHLFRLHDGFHLTFVLRHSDDGYIMSLDRLSFPLSLLGCKWDASRWRPLEVSTVLRVAGSLPCVDKGSEINNGEISYLSHLPCAGDLLPLRRLCRIT